MNGDDGVGQIRQVLGRQHPTGRSLIDEGIARLAAFELDEGRDRIALRQGRE